MLTRSLKQRSGVRQAQLERLEQRLYLTGDCALDVEGQEGEHRSAAAVNCFAYDLYDRLQESSGNVVLSPVSIATALSMAYAGAGGQTAQEMEDVLHLGSSPGIHESFGALISELDTSIGTGDEPYELEIANAMWPDDNIQLNDSFVQQVEQNYFGKAQTVDYSDGDTAKNTINDWVAEKTNNRIENLIEQLCSCTVMVLTNSIYFKTKWQQVEGTYFDDDGNPVDGPISPFGSAGDRQFVRPDGSKVEVPMMTAQLTTPRAEINGFDVVQLPFESDRLSMLFFMPQDASGPNEVDDELLVGIDNWLDTEPEPVKVELTIPKFKATVSTKLEKVLPEMGMRSAFGPADFSPMGIGGAHIDQVGHKAFLEVTEDGTEAAAATFVSFVICFAKGTPVLTPEGEKSIEELKPGDLVLSRSEGDPDGPIEAKVIEETFGGESELLDLNIDGQVIRATPRHPFFVKDRGWTEAGELKPGDLLATDLSSWKKLQNVSSSGQVEPVYNFRVADHHTYFVGKESWGFAVWTHNSCFGEAINVDRPFHFVIRDNVTSTMLFMGRINDPTETEAELPQVQVIDPIAGDFDGDGDVDSADRTIIAQNWTGALGAGEGDRTFAQGDADGDGDVDSADVTLMVQNWTGAQLAAATPRPIPVIDVTPATVVEDDDDSEALDSVFAEETQLEDVLRPTRSFFMA